MAELFLICEGPTNGRDLRVLNVVIAQKFSKAVRIEAAGGATSLGSVPKWFEEKSRWPLRSGTLGPPVDRAYSVEDRDYASTQEVEASWRPASKRFMWHRHEIENYLLDPRVVATAFEALRPDVDSWPATYARTPDEISALLNHLCTEMLENHVGWLTYSTLVDDKRGRVDTTISRPSPPLGARATRDHWLEYLAHECSRTKRDCTIFAGLEEFDEKHIGDVYDQLRADCALRGRLPDEVGGHELMSSLLAHMNQNGISHISQSLFETELIKALDREYVRGYFQPDDFGELADRLI